MDLSNGFGHFKKQHHAPIIQPLDHALQFGLLSQSLSRNFLPARRSAEQLVRIYAEYADQRRCSCKTWSIDLPFYRTHGIHRRADGFREGHLAQFALFPGCPHGGSELLFYFSHALA